MKNTIVYSTCNQNSYLYNWDRSLSMWLHPELRKACQQEACDSYYSQKYAYLKSRNFFNQAKPTEFGTILDESVIENNIINVPQISFETTDHCNLRCRYCSLSDLYTFKGKREQKNIDSRRAFRLLRYIFDLKSEGSTLAIGFFGGEPLVNGAFICEVLEELKRLNETKHLKLEFTITTNATLLDRYMDLLVENQFAILISLDGDEQGQSFRTFACDGKNSFQQAVQNIDLLYKKYPDFFEKNVKFNAVLNSRNSVQSIYEFIYNRYHKIPSIAQINGDHLNPEKKDLFNRLFQDRQASEKQFYASDSNLRETMLERSIQFNVLKDFLSSALGFYFVNPLDLLFDHICLIPTKTCSPFQRKMYLSTHNELLPCEKVSYAYALGKVDETVEIDVKAAARRYSSYYERIQSVCRECYNLRTCSICLLTLDNLDELGTERFRCPEYLDEDMFRNKLGRIFSYMEAHPKYFAQAIDKKLKEREEA